MVIVLAGLLVARFIGRGSDDLETIQPIGGTDTLAAQPDAQATAQTTTAATYGAEGTQAAAAQAYQPEAYQQAYQPLLRNPSLSRTTTVRWTPLYRKTLHRRAATFQPVAQAAVDVQPAQAVAPQPVSVPSQGGQSVDRCQRPHVARDERRYQPLVERHGLAKGLTDAYDSGSERGPRKERCRVCG